MGLTDDQIDALHASLGMVLGLAVSVDSDSNRFPVDWLFHFRWSGKKPTSLNGMPIHFVTVRVGVREHINIYGGINLGMNYRSPTASSDLIPSRQVGSRTSAFVPAVQKLGAR